MSEPRSSPCPHCHRLHPTTACDCAGTADRQRQIEGSDNIIPFRRHFEPRVPTPDPDFEPDGPTAA